MSKQEAQDTIGHILSGTYERDAIHIAMAQVVANERLNAGEHIGFVKGSTKLVTAEDTHEFIGIIDPFLTRSVKAGESCWMMLYPNTITNLRHAWEHPAFTTIEQSDSETYLRDFCDAEGITYAALIDAFKHDNWGEYVTIKDQDMHGEISKDVLYHATNILGKEIVGNPTYFSCSC